MKPNTIKSFFELGTLYRHLVTDKPVERRQTKHPFLFKGIGAFGPFRAFVTGNGKLLLHYSGKLHTYSFWNERKWHSAVGRTPEESWNNINLIWGRAAYVRGGKQALINGGWLQKRLFLGGCFGRSWKIIALASTFIPHIMDDAKNCPIIARGKIRAFIGWQGDLNQMNEFARDWAWLGGVKIPFVPISRPDGLAFKPQSRRDIYYIMALSSTHYYTPAANRWLLANQHRRHDIPHIDRRFAEYVTDGFQLKQQLEEAGYQVPAIQKLDVVTWSKQIHEIWDKEQTEIMLRRDAATNAMPLPGENLIPELEHLRIKTKGDLRRAGIECHHCVGSYANRTNMAHYRRGNVVCQVQWHTGTGNDRWYEQPGVTVNQCYDFANSTTEASIEFRRVVERYVAEIDVTKPEFIDRAKQWEEQEEYDLFDTPIRRYEEIPF